MSVIFHVLKEEFERLQQTESGYSKAIAGMPKGSPRILQRRNKKYLYLERRDGKKVVYDYIGPPDGDKAKGILVQVDQRKRYDKLLKETKAALKEVQKVLRGKI